MKYLQKLVDIRGYELPTNLQNFTQKDLTEVKIFQKVLGGGATFFSEAPCIFANISVLDECICTKYILDY